MFAFTSMGGRVDTSMNRSKGPYVFRISGKKLRKNHSLLSSIYIILKMRQTTESTLN